MNNDIIRNIKGLNFKYEIDTSCFQMKSNMEMISKDISFLNQN